MAEPLKHKQLREHHSRMHRIVANFTKSAFRRIGLGLTEGLLIAGLTFGPAVFPTHTFGDVAAVATAKDLHPDLKKLPKVSLQEMRKLAKESEKYQQGDTEDREMFTTGIYSRFVGGALASSVTICRIRGCLSTVEPVPDKFMGIAVNGKGVAGIDLAELDRLYRLATGKEMRYVRLVVEVGNDAKVGEYIQVFAVPVEESQGEVNEDIPIMATAYTVRDKSAWNERYLYISQ